MSAPTYQLPLGTQPQPQYGDAHPQQYSYQPADTSSNEYVYSTQPQGVKQQQYPTQYITQQHSAGPEYNGGQWVTQNSQTQGYSAPPQTQYSTQAQYTQPQYTYTSQQTGGQTSMQVQPSQQFKYQQPEEPQYQQQQGNASYEQYQQQQEGSYQPQPQYQQNQNQGEWQQPQQQQFSNMDISPETQNQLATLYHQYMDQGEQEYQQGSYHQQGSYQQHGFQQPEPADNYQGHAQGHYRAPSQVSQAPSQCPVHGHQPSVPPSVRQQGNRTSSVAYAPSPTNNKASPQKKKRGCC
eukprot:GHVN01098877.1.p1 GENE.GHVN01098877.1~~GHVN01098877.1.p1  ORF type:complete len:294 (+),score=55.92 GHVN01098877.1:69-950(+)